MDGKQRRMWDLDESPWIEHLTETNEKKFMLSESQSIPVGSLWQRSLTSQSSGDRETRNQGYGIQRLSPSDPTLPAGLSPLKLS